MKGVEKIMTVKECYSLIHGNYEEAKERFDSEERVKKFLTMFLKDDNYQKLCEAMEEGNCEDAFLYAHTLKGLCANLSLTVLFEEAKALTELLRGGELSGEAFECFERVKEKYDVARKAIEELCNDE